MFNYNPEACTNAHGGQTRHPSNTPGLGNAWDWDAITGLAEPGLTMELT